MDLKKREIDEKIKESRAFFKSGKTFNIDYRVDQLKKLLKTLGNREEDIYKALKKDLNKSKTESYMTEVSLVREEIRYALENLYSLTSEELKKASLSQFPSRASTLNEPYGLVLIISPWNYPFQLSLVPLVSAIAAGNCVIIKPSSRSKASSKLLKFIIEESFDQGLVQFIEGSALENNNLISRKYDYIFFTGSYQSGKKIMLQAAENLTPICLELGGKSPCIVDGTFNLKKTARRIVFGKITNAGQTCVAPDYVLVKREYKDELIYEIKKALKRAIPSSNYAKESYPKIIDQDHMEELEELLSDSKIISPDDHFYNGEKTSFINRETNQFYPIILDRVSWTDEVMQEEIFGPILPIIIYDDEEEIFSKFEDLDKPLALYVFTGDDGFYQKIKERISAGSILRNDTLLQLASTYLPFGGVGKSGIGAYHGKYGFETFSHKKSLLEKREYLDVKERYQPYSNRSFNILKRILG